MPILSINRARAITLAFLLPFFGILAWIIIIPPLIPEVPASETITDRAGNPLGEVLTQGKRHISLNSVESHPFLIQSLITLEDAHFFEHAWVSPTGLIRSMVRNMESSFLGETGPTQGGSTLTMGLARNILGINRSRTLTHKTQEMFLALRIEAHFSKNEILQMYLNRVHFWRLAIGIEAASNSYYGKSLDSLTQAEVLGLITSINNPRLYDPIREPEAFHARFEQNLDRLQQEWVISEEVRGMLSREPLQYETPQSKLPYVLDALRRTNSSTTHTSIDGYLTERVDRIAQSIRTDLQYRNVSDFGILIVDRETLQVRVLIGGADYFGKAGQVSAIFSPRQVWSTIKPFTYLLSIIQWRQMTDMILDAPVRFPTAEGTSYEPKNYSLQYRGLISLNEALAWSINVPAVKLAREVWWEALLTFLRSLGITSLTESSDHYGLALTLGVGEISLWELLRAYTIFAKEGALCEFSLDEAAFGKCSPKVKPELSQAIVSALSHQKYKSEEFPFESALDFWEGRVFVKTGTSRNFRDNYAIGFSEKYLMAVWTGNKDGSNMRGVSGASGAGEIFGAIIREVDPESRIMESPKYEENTTHTSSNTPSLVLTSPLPWSMYRLDTALPDTRQKISIRFWTKISYDMVTFLLDGKPLKEDYIWISSLSLGKHSVRVQLSKNGAVVGEVAGEFVKGE